ncbi:hypothetical protein [Kitasatospora sp. NPDC048407]|uniref:hypothetical protein n=1 Tax=Kitasatospora sp. NPDC048407 TaxID=3364051 RepID=UPI003718F015
MTTRPDFGDDTEAARLYDFLRGQQPAPVPGERPTPACMPQHRPASTPEEIARREGLDLGLDLAALRRPARKPVGRRPGSPTDRRPRPGGRSRRAQPSVEDLVLRAVRVCCPSLVPGRAVEVARQWVRSGCPLLELEEWMAALGVHGASVASDCLERGLSVRVLDVVVDGMHVRRRLRGGESVDSVLALAAIHSITLADRPNPQG